MCCRNGRLTHTSCMKWGGICNYSTHLFPKRRRLAVARPTKVLASSLLAGKMDNIVRVRSNQLVVSMLERDFTQSLLVKVGNRFDRSVDRLVDRRPLMKRSVTTSLAKN